ncbi:MAG: 50S ribosomal protein L13 [Candidatus Electryonea clarkiae]|nr:50S ribosomal protein L13 [Candidatus Electryonea clarkiae]MDP8288745.1 50S ribosomal protein L13 [Candidatus Electryonea clarkiae]
MKTKHLNSDTVEREWFEVSAEGLILGRLATRIATVLRGKHKPTFSPHVDGGDFIVVTNADKFKLSGRKNTDKYYFVHTGYPGGGRKIKITEMMAKSPEKVIRRAVWGMLPKGRLGRRQIKKLKIYTGSAHPHEAQKPQPLPM